MLGLTRRQRLVSLAVVCAGVATAVLALLWPPAAIAGLAAICACGVIVSVDTRSKLTALKRQLRQKPRSDGQASARALTERIAELEDELAAAEHENARLDDLSRASFRQAIRQYIRVVRAEHRLRVPQLSAALQLPHKLRNLEFAASHGIGVPEIYRVWPDIASIDLSDLPDRFVLKADGGAGSVGVFPLEQIGNGRFRVVNERTEYSQHDLQELLGSLGRKARAPFFAEELLYAADGSAIPADVKCYMFYGKVGQVLVRTVGVHADASTIRLKFVDQNGVDFGPVAVGRTHDPSIEVPSSLPQIIEAAKHLSRAIGLPFCRVDLYDTARGIVLGEITRAPSGGNERFIEEHDELLGKRWLDGSARLEADLNAGRPVGALFGTMSDLKLYPADDHPRSPARFPRTVLQCSDWCE